MSPTNFPATSAKHRGRAHTSGVIHKGALEHKKAIETLNEEYATVKHHLNQHQDLEPSFSFKIDRQWKSSLVHQIGEAILISNSPKTDLSLFCTSWLPQTDLAFYLLQWSILRSFDILCILGKIGCISFLWPMSKGALDPSSTLI